MKKSILKSILVALLIISNLIGIAQTPAWAVGAPLNAWIEIPGTSGAGGTPIESFSGWAQLPNGKIAITLAGGHGDGQKNSTAVIDMLAAAPAWVEVGQESSVHVDDVAYQPDGKPTSSHTYYTTMWVPTLNRLMRIGCLFASGPLTKIFPTVDGFSLNTNTWDPEGTHPNIPGGGNGCMYNPVTDRVLIVGGEKYFDPVTGTNTNLTLSGISFMPRFPWCWDSKRNQAFGICFGDGQGYSVSAGIVAAKIVGTTVTPITIAASAARDQFAADVPLYMGSVYDPVHDWFLLYEGRDSGETGRIYKVIPNNTSTWTMELFVFGSGGITPAAVVLSGLMNKFTYIPELKGIVMMATKANNLYFMRTGPIVATAMSDNELLTEQLTVFPNPSNTTFNVSLNSAYTGEVIISIKNTLGQRIKQVSLNKTDFYMESTINLEGEARGVYFLQIQTSNGSSARQLIKLEDR